MKTINHQEDINEAEQRKKITFLNDQFRTTGIGGKIVITQGIANLGTEAFFNIIQAVQNFNAFDKDNDPYEEHDFGAIMLDQSIKIYFKIDYYDRQMKFGSEDPSDPKETTRVLTIMLAEEY